MEHKLVKHLGGCHCGAVRFEIEAPAELEIGDCDWEKHYPEGRGRY